MNEEAVVELCMAFLNRYFGTGDAPADLGHEDMRCFGLRLVSLGTERAPQAELVHFMRANGLNAVLECGVVSGGSIDVIIFDQKWSPICAIELKHRSANQGTITPLVKEMDADRNRHQHGGQNQLPLIQIGLFTEIEGIDNWGLAPPHFGLYKFLVAHFNGPPNQNLRMQALPNNFDGQWHVPAVSSQFLLGDLTVHGRVGSIVRVVQPRI